MHLCAVSTVTCTPFPTGDLLTLISMWPQSIWAFISRASKQAVSTIKCKLDFRPVHSVLQFPETEIDLHLYYFCITTCFEAQERENVTTEGNNNKKHKTNAVILTFCVVCTYTSGSVRRHFGETARLGRAFVFLRRLIEDYTWIHTSQLFFDKFSPSMNHHTLPA